MLMSSALLVLGLDWGLSWLPSSDPRELGKLLGTWEGCTLVGPLGVNWLEPWVDGKELGITIG